MEENEKPKTFMSRAFIFRIRHHKTIKPKTKAHSYNLKFNT